MKLTYKTTMFASFVGYIVQAVVNNFVPLLFLTLQQSYSLTLSQITFIITINFVIQLVVDVLGAIFVDRIGYRVSVVTAHVCAFCGLVLLTILPDLWGYAGILTAVGFYAVGGGLIEVIVSPIIEACPTENKEKAMSLLHSFYCWGHVGLVLLSTLFFGIFGVQNWKALALVWALIPLFNAVLFLKTPLYSLHEDGEKGLRLKELFSKKIFWALMLMMFCAGASELTISQWASTFAEEGLGVSKTVGDLAGPMGFALLMGLSRLIYGKYGHKIDLDRFMKFSCILCVASYLCIALVPSPIVGLAGLALCGFSVGIMWPGTYSTATAAIRGGGTQMFALLAFAGDVGCSSGPTFAGFVSEGFEGNLHMGLLAAVIFPVLLLIGQLLRKRIKA